MLSHRPKMVYSDGSVKSSMAIMFLVFNIFPRVFPDHTAAKLAASNNDNSLWYGAGKAFLSRPVLCLVRLR